MVNCAGRTRSIIGTQSLVNAGIPNPVMALRNGTIGWTLAGLPLATKAQARGGEPTVEGRALARQRAAQWASHSGVPLIGACLARFRAEAESHALHAGCARPCGVCAAGHPAGFASAPGGQLVQATDEWVGVRGGRIVLYDDDGVRAVWRRAGCARWVGARSMCWSPRRARSGARSAGAGARRGNGPRCCASMRRR